MSKLRWTGPSVRTFILSFLHLRHIFSLVWFRIFRSAEAEPEPVSHSLILMAGPTMISKVKAYWAPLILFGLGLFYQLVVLPRSFPTSHYDALGIKPYSSVEQVKEAYEKFSSKWNSGEEIPSTADFLKIQYAYELLTDPLWKRNYDIYGIDEQLHILEKVREQYGEESYSRIDLPLLDATDRSVHAFNVVTSEDFPSIFHDSKPWLIQNPDDPVSALLEGIANTGMVELGDIRLATHLAERKPIGQIFFRRGLPSLVAFPPGCKSSDCMTRFEGELSVDAVTDWFATAILKLPRIFYYTKESMVKVIFFSKTGERASPFVRQISRNYWAYASFAFVLWREEESSIWWNTFEVESAPAIVFLKDPGVKPVVYYGSFNNSRLSEVMEQNKLQELPQLRSVTSMELGCDARGYSRAGSDTTIWYCVILAGRLSPELNKMRERYCSFYLFSETSFETCGARRDMSDVPRLFIVRYKRNTTEDEAKIERKPRNIWDAMQEQEVDPASQLVVRYNGSDEIPQIAKWVSEIIQDGDSKDLPFYRAKTPELVPEDSEPLLTRSAQSLFSKSIGMKQRIRNIMGQCYDYLGDPRIGPALLLAALMSFGTIWLMRGQQLAHPSQSGQPGPSANEDENRPARRKRAKKGSNEAGPPSITDEEPKDAYQMPLLDSDSD
ncbi:J domain-containing protein [Citrus sinensis]|nr:J domain-containing protein [Citrus sinensis]